jgi:adenylate cyclase
MGRRGVEAAPDDAHARIAYGSMFLWMRQHDKAIAEAERAVQLDPNYAHGLFELGWFLQYAGRPAEALGYFDRAVRLDPHHASQFLHFIAQAHFQLSHYEEAVELLLRRLNRTPQSDSSRMLLAACYGHLGRNEEARAAWEELKAINPGFSLEQRRAVLPYKNPKDFNQIVNGLRKAGVQG